MQLVVWDDEPGATEAALTGTKFATLASIARWPAADRPPLVPAIAVTTDAWRLTIEHLGLDGAVAAALGGDEDASATLAASLTSQAPHPAVRQSVADALERLGPGPVAVRSSAVAEDRADRSFAGQYVTRLGVRSPDEVLEAYQACVASAWGAGVGAYRERTRGAIVDDPAMAVIVQPMVHTGEGRAGAALSDGAGGVTVEAVDGLGDELMSGRADPQRWLVGAGELPEDPAIRAVVEWVRRAERRTGRAVEVEFAIRDGEVAPTVLQLRPHRASPPPPAGGGTSPGAPEGAVGGLAVGSGRVVGPVCRLDGAEQMDRMVPGGVLVTASTDPSWLPLLAGAGAVVTDHGGLTSHAAIVCRELGLLAVVGCGDATRILRHGQHVEVHGDGVLGWVHPAELPEVS